VDFDELARLTEGFVGADIAWICDRALGLAIEECIQKDPASASKPSFNMEIRKKHYMQSLAEYEMLGSRLEEEDWVEGSATVHATKQNEGAPMNRVVPRWKAIKDIPGVMPSEDIREILKPEDGKLSASRCMCKQIFPSLRVPSPPFPLTHKWNFPIIFT